MTSAASNDSLRAARAMGVQHRAVQGELERILAARGLADDVELHTAIDALALLTGWQFREARTSRPLSSTQSQDLAAPRGTDTTEAQP